MNAKEDLSFGYEIDIDVLESKWENIDKTLQQFILTNQERIKQEIIPKISRPIESDISKDRLYIQLPKRLISRNQYLILFVYLKYLISINKTNEVAKIYVEIMKGVNSVDKIYAISLVFSIVIDKMSLDFLKFEANNALLSSDKKYILSKLPHLSNLKKGDFEVVVDEIMKGDFVVVFMPMLKMVYGVEYAKVMKIKLYSFYTQYYKQMYIIETLADNLIFEQEYQKQRDRFINNHRQQVASIQYKINPYIKYNDIDRLNLPKPIVNQKIDIYTTTKAIFYLIPKIKFGRTKVDLLNVINLNKEVVELLK